MAHALLPTFHSSLAERDIPSRGEISLATEFFLWARRWCLESSILDIIKLGDYCFGCLILLLQKVAQYRLRDNDLPYAIHHPCFLSVETTPKIIFISSLAASFDHTANFGNFVYCDIFIGGNIVREMAFGAFSRGGIFNRED